MLVISTVIIMTQPYPLADKLLASTHRVENQPPPLENYNSYTADRVLQEGVKREGITDDTSLKTFGFWAGSAKAIALGFDANRYPPQLVTHDQQGHRIDLR